MPHSSDTHENAAADGESDDVLYDRHGRRIRYLRLSLTDACNFNCGFCRPGENSCRSVGRDVLSMEERLRLCGVFSRLGVVNYKITGGEPFMSPDALPTMERLKKEIHANSVTVTTNGSTLDRHAPELAAIGVDGVNVSLNAMSQAAYQKIIGRDFDLHRVLDNVLLTKRLGLNVKLNMVPIRGLNDGDIPALLSFALENDLHLRFIELMPIGEAREYQGLGFDEIVRVVEERFGPVETFPDRLGNGPAAYFSVKGYAARIGFIAAVSKEFCSQCNRIRLTSDGFLKTCLHHPHGTDLTAPLREGRTDDELAALVRSTIMDKPEKHRFSQKPSDDSRSEEPMYRIGG